MAFAPKSSNNSRLGAESLLDEKYFALSIDKL
jgi:hypothetical protein